MSHDAFSNPTQNSVIRKEDGHNMTAGTAIEQVSPVSTFDGVPLSPLSSALLYCTSNMHPAKVIDQCSRILDIRSSQTRSFAARGPPVSTRSETTTVIER